MRCLCCIIHVMTSLFMQTENVVYVASYYDHVVGVAVHFFMRLIR